MFQQHSAPISPSSSLFSSLSLSHGLDFAPVFDLSHGAYAGGGQLSPTTSRGLSHQPQYLAHSHSHSGSPSCTTTALHPQQHFLSIQRLPHCPSTSRFISTGHTLRSHMRRLRARMEHQTPHDVAAQQEAAKDYQPALQVCRLQPHAQLPTLFAPITADADPWRVQAQVNLGMACHSLHPQRQ